MKQKLQAHRVAGVSPLDSSHQKKEPPLSGGIKLEGHIHLTCPPSECYKIWRNFENLPSFMNHVESVIVEDDRHSHWLVKAPADTTMEWDAEIIEDHPNERISWRSTENAQVDNAGSVQFAPAPDGTDVKVVLTYNPPGGSLGAALSNLFGENPASQIAEDLTRFKEVVDRQCRPKT